MSDLPILQTHLPFRIAFDRKQIAPTAATTCAQSRHVMLLLSHAMFRTMQRIQFQAWLRTVPIEMLDVDQCAVP